MKFPILYGIALDVLPAQASAVPCERVFSSSKDTIPLKRANLSPSLMSALQFLKYAYRSNRLGFTSYYIATEEESENDILTPELMEELTTAGRFEELEDLLATSVVQYDTSSIL
ncbi:hypothetical protein FRC03_000753 [Tulasnella sp. 419]|nr:hypothetical protein FRC03_000753 [Tulasnella sp. 419]